VVAVEKEDYPALRRMAKKQGSQRKYNLHELKKMSSEIDYVVRKFYSSLHEIFKILKPSYQFNR
jgi:hypothetical protein